MKDLLELNNQTLIFCSRFCDSTQIEAIYIIQKSSSLIMVVYIKFKMKSLIKRQISKYSTKDNHRKLTDSLNYLLPTN